MEHSIPQAFIWRRLHSLTGLFFVLFLIEHILVNSQAALFLGEDGEGFIHAVNAIHNFPYLPIIEFFLLGVPILVHMVLGVQYLRTSHYNSFTSDGSKPQLPLTRNKAYTWQRITSWILLFGIIGHVVQMRFIEEPLQAQLGAQEYYLIRVQNDEGLPTLAARLDVSLIDQPQIDLYKAKLSQLVSSTNLEKQVIKQQKAWIQALEGRPLKPNQVIVQTKDFGTAELLMVRETFKMPLMVALYTIFLLAACFHGFNGLWTFMIKWGITLSVRSQKLMMKISTFLMVLISSLGLAAIWITYWLNLKQ